MHPETRITANSPMMMSVVVYFFGMVTLPMDILQYFLLRYLGVMIWFLEIAPFMNGIFGGFLYLFTLYRNPRSRRLGQPFGLPASVAKHFGVLLS
jgi:positive regulator of sigma E activity